MVLVEVLNLSKDCLRRLKHELVLGPAHPVDILVAEYSNFIGEAGELLAGHNLNGLLLLVAVEALHTLALVLQANFTLHLISIHVYGLIVFPFVVLVLLYLRPTRVAVLGLRGRRRHVWRLHFVMFVLHVCVQGRVGPVCFPA